MKSFIDRLIEKVKKKRSHVCVGLDPHLEQLPKHLMNKAREKVKGDNSRQVALGLAIWWFNKTIIDNIYDIAVAVKPQVAFYEKVGSSGMLALKETVQYARQKGLLVILDGKRNDIGSTARAYAEAYLKGQGLDNSIQADAITVNPYLGVDGIKPFIENKENGAFVLIKTSNPSSGDLQDLVLKDGNKLYQKMGQYVSEWGQNSIGENGYSNLGAVVGATYPEELKILRYEMPHSYFLIPGFGVQGGSVLDVVNGFNDDGLGAIVNSSRGIIFAYRREPWSGRFVEKEFGLAARAAALDMKDKINSALGGRR
ncbi:orotidine-5'-phosphate decarboxylase [Halothermothrix orenii]|uniref:Orotidine 5'-phosphate decarboxylase n=1 Tax=Halothermothrix orenii (strain H 168 / OCM 544 / DSM 9562) TaxID=373903 RepID=B8CWM6_HALOH|nr:orotidine-5'-phosphate decarboxylase [Halothermothrix orenii]ACL69695.1 Orotidine-5'-phosphate decarboxylase [Halothermothrix orenii H 168]